MASKVNKEVAAALEAAGLRPHAAAVLYQQNTSEIKDDLAQLSMIMKNDVSPPGQMSRQEASFLLWYHSLFNGGERALELLNNGLVGICLQVLESGRALQGSKTPEKTCATGILMTLCMTDRLNGGALGACDVLVRQNKGTNLSGVKVLHDLLLEAGDNVRGYAARCLQYLAEEPQARMSLTKVMGGRLPYLPLYIEAITQHKNLVAASSITAFLVALLRGQPGLVDAACKGGLVEAVMHGLRHFKIDALVHHLAELLAILLQDPQSWDTVVKGGGLRLLVDLLGPPPDSIMKNEMENYGHILHPGSPHTRPQKEENAQAAVEEEKPKEAQELASQGDSPRVSGMQRKFTPWGAPVKGATQNPPSPEKTGREKERRSSSEEGSKQEAKPKGPQAEKSEGSAKSQEAPSAPSPRAPPKSLDQLLCRNTATLQWNALASMKTRGTVTGCLYTLSQHTEHMHTMSSLLAASRLVPLMDAVLNPPEQAKKKGATQGSKAKKLKLSNEDTAVLVNITGTLKFLTLVAANCYRVAKLNGLPNLLMLYKESKHTLLRRNAQVIIANISTVAECGQMLYDAKVPETFLVAVPIRLTPLEVESLRVEFPDAPQGVKAPQ